MVKKIKEAEEIPEESQTVKQKKEHALKLKKAIKKASSNVKKYLDQKQIMKAASAL